MEELRPTRKGVYLILILEFAGGYLFREEHSEIWTEYCSKPTSS